ncbi:MAG: shikimate kinase [Bacilli bacterium]
MEYGLIGKKLIHSYSKEIHEQLVDYQYELKELTDNEQFSEFMKMADFRAVNVTIPYKEVVIPFLDFLSEESQEIHAINTIINKNGKLYGYNTDYYGLKDMILHFNIPICGKKVFILGTGGTAKTASKVVKDLGALKIYLVSRNKKDNVITYEEMINDFNNDVEVIISTTPYGMYPSLNVESIINIDKFKNLQGVVDVIYNPLKTQLIVDAERKTIPCCGGLYMLIAQAFYACELFHDCEFDKNKIVEIYKNIKKEKENIVLIGMPSCGKSALGKLVAQKLNRQFIDIDSLIEQRINMTITTFFEKYGEDIFRNIESEVIKEVSQNVSLVIATGGGAVLRKENVSYLKQNGRIFYIERPLSFLKSTPSRPLSSTYEALKQRYEERTPLYAKVCDIKIEACDSKDENVNLIIKKWEDGIL